MWGSRACRVGFEIPSKAMGNSAMIILACVPLVFNSLIATALVLTTCHQGAREIEAIDFPLVPLTLPTPERFKDKEEMVAFTKAKSSYGFGRPPLVEEHKINGTKIYVMEYRKELLNGYFVYRDFKGVLVRILETNFFPERLFFSSDNKELVIKKGLNEPDEDVVAIRNFNNITKLYLNYPVKEK